MKRAIVYCRVSTDEQKNNNSFSAQRTDGHKYAEKHGLTVVDVLNEDYTGMSIDRPMFNRLLELADAELIDAVIVQHPDRLGRDHHLGAALTLLVNRGIDVHACNRGLISDEDDENAQIQNGVDVFISGIERRNLRRRLRRGMVEKVKESGKMPGYGGSAPYGYAWVGFRRDRKLVVNEEEAAIVRQVFQWYDSGVSVMHIAERLEAARVKRPYETRVQNSKDNRGGDPYKWITPSLYSMLKNTIYIGTFMAFQRKHSDVKQRLHNEPVPVATEPIIDPALFDRVQQRLANGRKLAQRNTQRFYLLRCLVKCECGAAVIGCNDRDYRYYRCGATIRKRDRVKPCNESRYNAANVDYTVWKWIEENVLNEENLKQGIEHHNAESGGNKQRLEDERDYYTSKIAQAEQEKTRLLQTYTAGIYTLDEIAAEKRRLDDSIAELDQQRTIVAQKLAGLGLSDTDAANLLALVEAVKASARNPSDEAKRAIVEACQTEVRLYRKDGQPWCHIAVNLTVQSGDTIIVSRVL